MAKIRANGDFEFHSVGQGLFYSGTIQLPSHRNMRFDYVYDCGSSRQENISKEVRQYKENYLTSGHLNMLIISHFHKDHVSGLDELLKDIRVDYVFLPYLLPAERLILALMYPNMPAWYYEFLHDPIIFLLERNVGTVVLFGTGGQEGEGGTPPGDISPEPPEKILIKLKDIPDSDKKAIFERENARNIYAQYFREKRLMLKTHRGYVIALGIWVFRFFNYKLPTESLSDFRSCAQDVLNGISVKDAIRHKHWRDKMRKKCYEKIKNNLASDFNNTSLIVYHTPVGNYYGESFIYPFSRRCCWWRHRYYEEWCPFPCYFEERFGQFLTGDINLNFDYDQIRKRFKHYFPHTLLVQIPHHGAWKNWNSDILEKIPSPSLWIASAGIRNNYGHPSVKVIDDILFHRHCFAWSNEQERVIVRGEVEWL